MKITDGYKGEKLVLALGFFDSLHKGHEDLIGRTKALARDIGAKSAVFTFAGNPYFVKAEDRNVVLTFDERVKKLLDMGVDYVVSAVPTKAFFAMDRQEFLDGILREYNVVGFASGTDYAFGKGALGNADYLSEYATQKGLTYASVPLTVLNGEKVATRDIVRHITDGRVDEASYLLGYGYFLSGEVRRGRGDGKRSCVPTVNLDFGTEKVVPARGVYATETEIDGQVYCSVTNVGHHPTYQDFTENVETFVLDFDGDVYGKEIKVSFKKYIRDITAFSSPDELRARILKDAEISRNTEWKI